MRLLMGLGCASIVCLFLAGEAAAQSGTRYIPPPPPQTKGEAPAYLTIRVPADAKLWIDSAPTRQTGTHRRFVTPPLSTSYRYSYRVKATWKANGKEVTREKKVYVQGGQRVFVDMLREPLKQPPEKTSSKEKPKG
ncbi:MAG: hypothetical protein KatS3mg105_4311 [Gemmatales bacterium]|nr:MAG: hypothetical protein KatS3mg105_4311 [Gemmatales bacterium]